MNKRNPSTKYRAQFSFYCDGTDTECRGTMLGVGMAIREGMDHYDLENKVKWQLDCFHKEGKECK